MSKVKICGLFREEDIQYVNTYLPDYVGFVFAKSKRQINKEQAMIFKKMLDPKIEVVGVFVNEEIEQIVELVEQGIIDIVQLHGEEDTLYIEELKSRVATKIIKAIKIKDKKDIEDIHFDVDYYLLDNAVGGSGQSFDWTGITNIDKPFFLAGGISLDNIDKALQLPIYAIDISSGVETNGLKDKMKIEEIVRRMQDGSR